MEGYRSDTYGEAFADIYDDWYQHVSDADATARFVTARCGGGAVLELGVGSGRLAVPLAAGGTTVVGVDASASMLERCRPAVAGLPVHLVRADMAQVPLVGPFGAVLCAFNTLFNLRTLDEQRSALADAARLVAADGVVVLEAATGEGLDTGPPSSVGVTRLSTDAVVLTATVLDRGEQVLSGQHVEISAEGIRLRPWRVRWVTPAQLDALAAEVGLALAERVGDWDGRPFDADCDRHVSVYRRR